MQPLNFGRSAAVKLAFLSLFIAPAFAYYNSTVLVIGTSGDVTEEAVYILRSYGLTYQTLIFSQNGDNVLPPLETDDGGNYGLLIPVANVQFPNTTTSALTNDQWNTLYAYQEKYSIRMVQVAASPNTKFGVKLVEGCCGAGVEQNVSLVAEVMEKEFPTSGLL